MRKAFFAVACVAAVAGCPQSQGASEIDGGADAPAADARLPPGAELVAHTTALAAFTVAKSPDGTVHVAWSEPPSSMWQPVYYRKRSPAGGWTEAADTGVFTTAAPALTAALIVDATGAVWLVASDVRAPTRLAVTPCAEQCPGAWQPVFERPEFERVTAVTGALGPDGAVHVVFAAAKPQLIGDDLAESRLFHLSKPAGGDWDAVAEIGDTPLFTAGLPPPQLHVGVDGALWLVWNDTCSVAPCCDDVIPLQWRRDPGAAAWVGPTAFPCEVSHNVRTTTGPTGEQLAVWAEAAAPADPPFLYVHTAPADGSSIGTVASIPVEWPAYPYAMTSASNDAVALVAWTYAQATGPGALTWVALTSSQGWYIVRDIVGPLDILAVCQAEAMLDSEALRFLWVGQGGADSYYLYFHEIAR